GSKAAERGDDAQAIARYERAVALDSASPQANGVLGAALVRTGRHAQARPYLERAVARADAPAIAYAALAVVLAAEGRDALAAQRGREALARDPGLGWAGNNLAWILATSADPAVRDPEEAVRVAEAAVRGTASPNAEFLDTLATAYAAAGRADDARRAAAEAAAARRARQAGPGPQPRDPPRAYHVRPPRRSLRCRSRRLRCAGSPRFAPRSTTRSSTRTGTCSSRCRCCSSASMRRRAPRPSS